MVASCWHALYSIPVRLAPSGKARFPGGLRAEAGTGPRGPLWQALGDRLPGMQAGKPNLGLVLGLGLGFVTNWPDLAVLTPKPKGVEWRAGHSASVHLWS